MLGIILTKYVQDHVRKTVKLMKRVKELNKWEGGRKGGREEEGREERRGEGGRKRGERVIITKTCTDCIQITI
jgi:hypothetical protein